MAHQTEKPFNEGPEQLRLWSEEKHEKMRRFSASLQPKAEPPYCETDGVRKACSSEEGAIQDELPFPWASGRKEHS